RAVPGDRCASTLLRPRSAALDAEVVQSRGHAGDANAHSLIGQACERPAWLIGRCRASGAAPLAWGCRDAGRVGPLLLRSRTTQPDASRRLAARGVASVELERSRRRAGRHADELHGETLGPAALEEARSKA